MIEMKRRMFSALSWRVEARAASCPAAEGADVRHRWGNRMAMAGAHRSLPDLTDRAAVLCFHAVTAHRPDPEVESASLYVKDFRKLLRVLKSAFHVVPLAELVQAIRERRDCPPRAIAITFDDGYANNHTVAAEELAKLRMPWSAFLPAGLIEGQRWQWIDEVRVLLHRGRRNRLKLGWSGQATELDLATPAGRAEAVQRVHVLCRYVPEATRQERLAEFYAAYSADELEALRRQYPSFAPMNWDQANELKSAGVDVGSHTLNHIALGQQPVDVIHHELAAARALLQQRIGDHSPHLSYPYGREDALSIETDRLVAEFGYDCALTLEQELVHPATTNLLRVPRLIVSAQVGRVLFGLWQRFIR